MNATPADRSAPTIPLWSAASDGAHPEGGHPAVHMSMFVPDGAGPFAAMIVCPGGGYRMRAGHEGEPIARWLTSLDIAAFVLHYRVAPARHPTPLLDAQRAIRLVRHRAAGWSIRTHRVGILGFSAGGHLAATAATRFDHGDPDAGDPVERHSNRPDAVVLGYPVISFGDIAHLGSMHNLLGDDPPSELRQQLSADQQVSAVSPPAFLWHTADDAGVSVQHSLRFTAALARHGVPFELHVFPSGAHGLGLAADDPDVGRWTTLCATWLQNQGFCR